MGNCAVDAAFVVAVLREVVRSASSLGGSWKHLALGDVGYSAIVWTFIALEGLPLVNVVADSHHREGELLIVTGV